MSSEQTIRIKDQPLRCKHCGREKFFHRSAQLGTALLGFFELGFLNKSADVYVCSHCGFLHWFLEPAVEESPVQETGESAETDDLAESTECLECRQMIPAGTDTCPACGWSYNRHEDRSRTE
jgi:hypothetical protein